MRVNLNVPYEDKEKAKWLGAKWDNLKKIWYVIDPEDLMPFRKWLEYEIPKSWKGLNTETKYKSKKNSNKKK